MKFETLCLTAENLSEVQTDLERQLASLNVTGNTAATFKAQTENLADVSFGRRLFIEV